MPSPSTSPASRPRSARPHSLAGCPFEPVRPSRLAPTDPSPGGPTVTRFPPKRGQDLTAEGVSMRRILIILVALFAAALPAGALADDGKDNGGLLLRLDGDYTVPTGQELNALVVVHGDVVVDGLVHSSVTVIDGDVRINGTVEGDLQVWRGDVTLSATSAGRTVERVRGDLVRDPGATVTGDVSESSGVFLRAGWLFFFGLLFFIGLGVAMMVVSTGFALVAGKQLGEAAVSLTAKPWQTIVSGIITVLALPVAAVVAIATIVGFW